MEGTYRMARLRFLKVAQGKALADLEKLVGTMIENQCATPPQKTGNGWNVSSAVGIYGFIANDK